MADRHKRQPLSRRGRTKLALLTVGGILACVLISVVFNGILFEDAPSQYRNDALLSAIVLPILLAGPLFVYLSLKLRDLSILNRRLAALAAHDSLTNLLNRGAFTHGVEQKLKDEGRHAACPGALLLIDADHFKSINDSFGHDVGDMVLKAIAGALTGVLRADDLIGRIGGEEFGAFMGRIDRHGAEDAAERLRAAVADLEFTTPDGERVTASVSLGCAYFDAATSFEVLYRAADRSLYAAKSTGRNRVSFMHLGANLLPVLPG